MKKLFPIILILLGLGGGIGAGIFLKPEPELDMAADHPCGELDNEGTPQKIVAEKQEDTPNPDLEYVKLNNQFVVPVVKGERVASLVVMSISIEVQLGTKDTVFQREPKIRDAILSVLFDHAALGGFDGAFTSSAKLDTLRAALIYEVQGILTTEIAKNILITDLVRQDA